MDKDIIKENNELIALFMGYKYQYLAEEDYSDCGGLYTIVKYYSNHPLAFEHWGKNGEPNFRAVFPNNTDFKYLAIEISGYPSFVLDNELKYHRDWNWLNEILEKIESLGYEYTIDRYGCHITYFVQQFKEDSNIVICEEDVTKIENVYNACVEFIKYYNEKR